MKLGRITAVTITSPDLDRVVDIYSKYLKYRLVSSTRVLPDQAKVGMLRVFKTPRWYI